MTTSLDLQAVIEARFASSTTVPIEFFEEQAGRIAQACWAMARRFHRGGRLIAFGDGSAATDAQHVSVEFVHPVIVGKRALPAIALTNDSATLTGLACSGGYETAFARQLGVLGRPEDMALAISADGRDGGVLTGLRQARAMELLTLALSGGDGGLLAREPMDFCFVVPSGDPMTVQETHETLYHVLWELVHVFFEHEGLLEVVSIEP